MTVLAALRWTLLLSLGAGAARAAAQQEPPPAPVDVHALARRWRTEELTAEERASIAATMLAEGERGAAPLSSAVRVDIEERDGRYRKESARLVRDFRRAAPAVLRRRLGRTGDARVEVLRDEVLDRSRSADLTKAIVRSEIDPRIAELRELLVVTPAQVFAAVPALGERAAALRAGADVLVQLFDIKDRIERVLLRTDAGRRLVELHEPAADPRGYAEELERALVQAAWLATPMSARDARVLAANDELVSGIDSEEKAGIRKLNELRTLVGLPLLAIDVKLCAAARDHSADMVRLGFFSHTSPIEGKETPGRRAALAGTSAGAENIAAGQHRGAGAIEAWWYSPGHHRNMMSDASRVGLGRHADHWTQMFGG